VTIWELFHYILVGINTELLCGFRTESIRRILYKIQLFPPGHYMTSKDGEFVQWYKREWTDYDAKRQRNKYTAIKEGSSCSQAIDE
jgi:asparagine synthetase B (glutamine-hydrolysing)